LTEKLEFILSTKLPTIFKKFNNPRIGRWIFKKINYQQTF